MIPHEDAYQATQWARGVGKPVSLVTKNGLCWTMHLGNSWLTPVTPLDQRIRVMIAFERAVKALSIINRKEVLRNGR